ncbi:hypothetical protein Y032_0073g769 [Ancylostoma ceylanicum]|uniref:Uncharacterized protein n=1 Tax=Ancylostoma ceylanicum TaxID=53326 RepID=A0A016TVY0_9BILA|nr:hypothetical protein Y032_0073g769 [Ancylostoma ceylanicum]
MLANTNTYCRIRYVSAREALVSHNFHLRYRLFAEYIPWFISCSFIVSSSVMATLLFVVLLHNNQQRYHRLNNTSDMQDTLSIRFQLNENLKTMKLIRNVLVMCGCLNLLSFTLYTGARTEWLFHSNVAGHYYDAVFNLVLVT